MVTFSAFRDGKTNERKRKIVSRWRFSLRIQNLHKRPGKKHSNLAGLLHVLAGLGTKLFSLLRFEFCSKHAGIPLSSTRKTQEGSEEELSSGMRSRGLWSLYRDESRSAKRQPMHFGKQTASVSIWKCNLGYCCRCSSLGATRHRIRYDRNIWYYHRYGTGDPAPFGRYIRSIDHNTAWAYGGHTNGVAR